MDNFLLILVNSWFGTITMVSTAFTLCSVLLKSTSLVHPILPTTRKPSQHCPFWSGLVEF